MKKSAGRLLFALVLFVGMTSMVVRAETVSYPQDKPLFTMDLPSGWTVASNSESELRLDGPGISSLSIQPAAKFKVDVTEENAKTAACGVNKSALYNGENGTCSEPEEMTIAGHTAYSVIGSGPVGSKQCIVFTPDGKNWFGAVANPNMDNKPDPKTEEALKAIKGKSGSE